MIEDTNSGPVEEMLAAVRRMNEVATLHHAGHASEDDVEQAHDAAMTAHAAIAAPT